MSIRDRALSTEQFIPTQTTKAAIAKPDDAATAPRTTLRTSALATLRILMGLTLLWAFLDKTFGLGYATSTAQAWVGGGSPTKGFLGHIQVGPPQSLLRSWAGAWWVDSLFMVALLGIGLALLLGVGMRLAALASTALLGFMWIAEWPPARTTTAGAATSSTNPLIDYHLVYIVVVVVLAVYAAGNTWGFGRRWADLSLVRRLRWLR